MLFYCLLVLVGDVDLDYELVLKAANQLRLS